MLPSPNWKQRRISKETDDDVAEDLVDPCPRARCLALQSSRRTSRSPSRSWPSSRRPSSWSRGGLLPVCPAAVLLVSPAVVLLVSLVPGGPPGPRAAGLPRPPGVGGGRPGLLAVTVTFTAAPGPMPTANTANYGYGRSGYGYGDGSWRHRYWPYGVYVYSKVLTPAAAITPTSTATGLRAYRRVWTCSEE